MKKNKIVGPNKKYLTIAILWLFLPWFLV